MASVKSAKVVPLICTLAVVVSDILSFLANDLQKVGQGHGALFSH